MENGWNLWVWLDCIGVISGCCCKEVYRFPHITYPYSTCITCSSFFCSKHSYFCVHFKNVFCSCLFLCNITNVSQKTFEIVQQSRSREHGNIIISTRTYVDCAHESRDFYMRCTACRFKKVAADFVCGNGVVDINLLHI